MKRHLAIAITLILCVSQLWGAEPQKPRNNIFFGIGTLLEGGGFADENNPGLTVRVSYGRDYSINQRWSVMPGAGLKYQIGDLPNITKVFGNGADTMISADIFCQARYRTGSVIWGIGPALSYFIVPSRYNITPTDGQSSSFDNKAKYNSIIPSIMPNVTFPIGKHFQLGLEGSIGFLNATRQYDGLSRDASWLHYAVINFGWRW